MDFAQKLPRCLHFEGEFGAEINSFLPFVHWLWAAGEWDGRQILTYPGMAPYYAFLPPGSVLENQAPRQYVPPELRPAWLPTRDDHAPRGRAFELFPDYRALFANDLFTSPKPLLVLHNKYCVEWGGPPVNFLPPDLLAEALAALTEKFEIFYSRPGIAPPGADYSADHQPDYDLAERDILAAFPEVHIFEDLAAELRDVYSYNQLKLMLYANSYFHVTVQGGNAHLTALFGGSLILIYHRAGQEIRGSYRTGHFATAATPTPTLLLTQHPDDFSNALAAVTRAELAAGRVAIDLMDVRRLG